MLEVNKIYSYKELCEAIGEAVAEGGKNRKLQINRIKTYCNYTKPSSQKYLITEVYNESTREYLKNADNCSKYLACLILDALIIADRAGVDNPIMTRNEIYKTFWFCNDNYFDLLETKKIRQIDHIYNYTPDCYLSTYNYPKEDQTKDISRWLSVSKKIFGQVLNGAIKELKNYSFCEVHPTYRFYKEQIKYNGDKYYIPHDATEEELRQFLAIQRQVLEDLGFQNMQTVYANEGNSNKFYAKVKEYLKDELGYDTYSRSYKFITMKDIGTRPIFNRPQYNKLIIEKLKTSAQTKVIPEKLNELLIDKAIKK